MKTRYFGIFCFLLFVTCACSGNRDVYQQLEASNPPIVGEFTDPSRTIRVTLGNKFVIILDSNATTGYSWQAPERTTTVSLSAHRYEAPQSQLAGAGGREHFEFTVRSIGEEKLIFNYTRPWEKGIPPVKTVAFTVEVMNKKGNR